MGFDVAIASVLDIRVQKEAFDEGLLLRDFGKGHAGIGGICAFTGLVRDFNATGAVASMILEHYPGMAERQLRLIGEASQRRYGLEKLLIIHRYGELLAGDKIVLVITATVHRRQAFEACQYIMDYLKCDVPFWKREVSADGSERSVSACAEDIYDRDRWALNTE